MAYLKKWTSSWMNTLKKFCVSWNWVKKMGLKKGLKLIYFFSALFQLDKCAQMTIDSTKDLDSY